MNQPEGRRTSTDRPILVTTRTANSSEYVPLGRARSGSTSVFNAMRIRRKSDTNDASSTLESTISSVGSSFKRLLDRNKSVELTDSDSEDSKSNLLKVSLSTSRSNDSTFDNMELEQIPKIKIPTVFLDGMSMLKVSLKSKKRILLQIDPKTLVFTWKVTNKNLIQFDSTASSFHKFLSSAQSHTPYISKSYHFSVDDIRRMLCQKEASFYRDELNISREFENQWISISYFNHQKHKIKTLHLITDTEHDYKRLFNFLSSLQNLRKEICSKFLIDVENMDDKQKELIMINTTNSITNSAASKKEHMSFDDILKYIGRLNLNIGKSYLRGIFDSIPSVTKVNDQKVLDFNQFKEFIALLKKRKDLDLIWKTIADGDFIKISEVRLFIENVQCEAIDEASLSKIYGKFADNEGNWTCECLNQFLLSKFSKPVKEDITDDYFDRPINEYYISSSHNTYLTGKQIADYSSSEGYVRALQKGCKCIEIDIWDGNDPVTNEVIPIVCHGKAFTSWITLRNVLTTVKRYAFISSELPLILSLEINCSVECQLQVANLLKEILGDLLVLHGFDIPGLPTPMMLKRKILAKVKKTSKFVNIGVNEQGYLTSTTTSTSFSEDSQSTVNLTTSSRKRKREVIDELSDMAVYVQGIRFRNFSLPESKTFNHCFSLNEKTIDSMLKDDEKKKAIDKHNRKFLMRVYPHSMRLRSSNFIPIKYWTHGVQMVATNWQRYDIGQQINEALFEGPNKSGYYLKPKNLRTPLLKQTMRNELETFAILETKVNFQITIISAHQLPKPKHKEGVALNPFVKFEIFGAHFVKFTENISTTITVTDNGFNPLWNQTISGHMIASELVFIKFSLNGTINDEIEPVGSFICRFDNLKKGYRYLPLRDTIGEELIYSSLFVLIE